MSTLPGRGDKYRLIQDKRDPWGPKKDKTCRVLDVRDGWVRYTCGWGTVGEDSRAEIDKFLLVRERVA